MQDVLAASESLAVEAASAFELTAASAFRLPAASTFEIPAASAFQFPAASAFDLQLPIIAFGLQFGGPPSELQLIAGLIVAVILLLVFVLRTRIHAVLALIAAAAVAGLIGGMPAGDVVDSITRGFGSTLATIGLVIGFGVMLGRILQISGAAERLAYTLIRWLGAGREEWALTATGYVVSIAIFCDSAFVILEPLARALSRTTGKSVITLGICLAGGLMLTHHAIPPTPGPLGIAGILEVDIGLMIFWGLVITLPVMGAIVWYARAMGPRIEAMTRTDDAADLDRAFEAFEEGVQRREGDLPPLAVSAAPILVPIVLIFINTATSALVRFSGDPDLAASTAIQIIAFIGNPVIAVGLGVVLAAYTLVPGRSRYDVLSEMEKGVESAGIILLVTGAGGALGFVLRDSGAGQVIGESVVTLPLPAILIPFVISTLVRLIQGSGTVAMITGASIAAPILAAIPEVNMVFAAQAAAVGSMAFSYFNDSYFWVVNRFLGVKDAKPQLLTWSVPSTIGWFCSLILLLICDFFFG